MKTGKPVNFNKLHAAGCGMMLAKALLCNSGGFVRDSGGTRKFMESCRFIIAGNRERKRERKREEIPRRDR